MKQACQKINKQALAIRLWFTAVLHLDVHLVPVVVHHSCNILGSPYLLLDTFLHQPLHFETYLVD